MLWKEFIQMRRDRFTLAMMIGIPAIQLILFGYAIRIEVRHLPMVVLDESRTAESRALVDVLTNTGNFDVAGAVTSRDEIRQRIERGSAHAGLIIPPDYLRRLKRGRGAQAQLIVDAADPLSSSAAINAAALAGTATALSLSRLATTGVQPLEVRVRPWYNPDLESRWFFVPGVIGSLTLVMVTLLTAFAIVREREIGTLEQIMVTPIRPSEFILGKTLPFFLIGLADMAMIAVVGTLWFEVPFRGSIGVLLAGTVLFLVCMLGVGLFVSTISATQQQAMVSAFFFTMPAITFSGFGFPIRSMPQAVQWLTYLDPLRYFLVVLRGVYLKGVGLGVLWPQLAAMAVLGSALLTISVFRFHKSLD